ncbi:VWA domain-containing protein [Polaribacter sp.]|uniref:VWA domain-containing protein n=1 Tax=Polaribacter sp. TaxID=1920175 RepID=UPI0040483F2D
MQATVIFLLFLALLLSFSIAYFQYYYKEKSKHQFTPFLLILRALSLFLLLALFINPSIENEVYQNEKPVLSVLTDNSFSITFFDETKNVGAFQEKLSNNSVIKDKFDIQKFQFGQNLQLQDSLSFSDNETNIFEAISATNKLNSNKIAPVILLTDGNQTIGSDYEFLNSKQPIYPVVFGDTTTYADVKITQINANKYSFLGNQFPVEILLNYEGNENVTSVFTISTKGKTIFSKNVSFSAQKKSETILVNIESTAKGIHFYNASLRTIDNEKNTKNNTKDFTVEVIDEQTNVLILSSVLHPDLGVLKKAIESNKQRKSTISLITDFKNQINDFQLIVLYQVTNNFRNILTEINTAKIPYLFISGTNTDWNFVNAQQLGFQKRAINQTENYGATFNTSFTTLLQENIGFDDFPPLKDCFGEVLFSKEYQSLLFQNINGIQTKVPLLATVEHESHKFATLFGEGIWKWRAASFLNTNSFEEFDAFIGNLVSYLASNKKRNRLEVNAESLYSANSTINISAFYLDKTYKFDPRASLEISITNEATKKVSKFPFSLLNNTYQVAIENLASGVYNYTVTVLGQNLSKSGQFVISDYQIEEQFTRANVEKLEKIATNSGGKVYYKNQIDDLLRDLSKNENFYTIQKAAIKEQEILDWKWVLFVIIGFLTVEWFIRKYIGKI